MTGAVFCCQVSWTRIGSDAIASSAHKRVMLDAAAQSFVLLKNTDATLPLAKVWYCSLTHRTHADTTPTTRAYTHLHRLTHNTTTPFPHKHTQYRFMRTRTQHTYKETHHAYTQTHALTHIATTHLHVHTKRRTARLRTRHHHTRTSSHSARVQRQTLLRRHHMQNVLLTDRGWRWLVFTLLLILPF